MASRPDHDVDVAAAVESAVRELVSTQHWGESAFINLPLIYPGGSSVTVKVDRSSKGLRVSDNGFAYREIESFGAHGSFFKTADKIIADEGLERNSRAIFIDVPASHLTRAICDVASASWRVADKIARRAAEQDEAEIEDYLRERLIAVFGDGRVKPEHSVTGASTSDWNVSAVVQFPDHLAVFQAVGTHANSVYRTSTAFHDLAALDHAPALVAVVRDKKALGAKLGILSQAGRVIEDGQPDDVYKRAAA